MSAARGREEPEEARWARVTEIVGGALRRPDARERARFLRSACAGDGELRREVEELLGFEDADSGILAGPLLGRAGGGGEGGPAAAPEWQVLEPGQEVGPYRVERMLGVGGMGVVALAYDRKLDRHIALKVLRRECVTADLSRRFETECRVLARLDHPCIARIFDAGTLDRGPAEGLPYFAMEYVEGEPIDLWCDRRRSTVEDRLRLVLEVCDALGEAHRNLVVHRDLKPSNLLVTAAGEPKLLDFGIAKELDPPAGAEAGAEVTRTGHQPLTAAYASPEQVRGRPVTVATDVYSLGVLLYRLLCGHPPYLLDGDHLENVRAVCERQPPPPSTRAMLALEVWRRGVPEWVSPAVLASERRGDPRSLRRRLRGDLDSIVASALAKDPERRYRSMEQLAADLRRHLEGRPVSARGASVLYRAAKFARRARRQLVLAVLVSAVLIAGSLAWFDSRRRVQAVEQQRRRAAEQAAQAEGQARSLTLFARNLVRAVDPEAAGGRRLSARDILERGREQALASLGEEPELLAHQLEALGLAYQSLGDLSAARPLLEESLRLRRSVYGRAATGARGGDHRLVARGLNNLAALHYLSADRARAERLYRAALAMKRRLGQAPEDLAKVESNLATLLTFRGEYTEAEALYRRLLDTRRRAYGPDAPDVANSLRSLGNLLYLKSDFAAAEQVLGRALELRMAGSGARSLAVASVLSLLGRVRHAQGRLGDAAAVLSQALEVRLGMLGEDHLHVALTRKDLASVELELGGGGAAEERWRLAIGALRARLPAGSWQLADADSQLGARLAAAGRFEQAGPYLRTGYETLLRLRGEQALYTRQARDRLEEYRRARAATASAAVVRR